MAVIDTSVFVAIVSTHEPGHAASFAWFSQALSAVIPISAPSILLSEVAAAISRGQNDPQRAYRTLHMLTGTNFVSLVSITQALAFRSAEIAVDHKIRGCDAVFVALAEQLGEELVTLDTEQLARSTAVVTARRPS